MKRFLYLFLVFALYACSNESADNDTPDNNFSELIGIYEVVWVENEDNTIDCYTIEFKTDNTSEELFDDDGDDICGNQDIRIVRTYEITLDGSNIIRGDIGTGEEGVLSATLNGGDMMGVWDLATDAYAVTFEYNKNTQELYYNLYLEADDLIVYMFQKL